MEITLKDLEGLLKLEQTQTLTYTTKPLLGTGENYGSTMLAVEVKIFEKGDPSEPVGHHHYVAKMCPPSDLLQEWFNTPVTYKKELNLYTTMVPMLQQFQREHGVQNVMDFFSKLVGARLSLDPKSDKVDADAVILFDNLKYEGYQVGDRFKGFDLECAQLIIKDLAVFHAVPIAFKREKPKEFEEKILPHLQWPYEFRLSEEAETDLLRVILKLAGDDEECAKYTENIKTALFHGKQCYKIRPPLKELFATITHNDYWVNNTMLKFEDGKPVKNVMVDFQIIEYSSPGHDVLFFLYSSVDPAVLRDNYDSLVDLYYDTFVRTLKRLECDTNQFTFDLFQEELRDSAGSLQFYHTLIMLAPIFTKRGVVKELGDISKEDMMVASVETADEYPEKVRTVIRDFGKRGWI